MIFKRIKALLKIDVLFTLFVIFIGFLIINAKLNLTDNAKLDMVKIKNQRAVLLKEISLSHNNINNFKPESNSFNGVIITTLLRDKNNSIIGFKTVSDNLPYQACLRYGLDGDDFTTVNINNQILYKKNELAHRDKVLHLCLLQPTISKVELTTLLK